jgi:GNAT superfamily N-acetyltransferase
VSLTDTGSVADVMRSSLAEVVDYFHWDDPFAVEPWFSQVRLIYVCQRASCEPHDPTRMECFVHWDSRELWIGGLRVSAAWRLRGLGRQLVTAMENMATRLDLEVIRVFPLASARGFWRMLGYLPRGPTVRVLSKELSQARGCLLAHSNACELPHG